MRQLILLGYSGSIGQQVLKVLKEDKEYALVGIGACTSTKDIDEIKNLFPSLKSVALSGLKEYENKDLENIFLGKDALIKLIEEYKDAVIVNALVGLAGLSLTIKALKEGHEVLLANKESLVVGGDLINKILKENPKASIFPIDSEHSALTKLTNHEEEVEKLLITCSGGALRDFPLDKLNSATKDDVFKHPNWNMGKRITIDCATLVNKAFEVIEAHYLFNLPLNKIEVVMHDESIIHSMVLLKDNSILAEIGPSDMQIPISYALYKKRIKKDCFAPLSITDMHFRKMDNLRYPLFNKIINWYNDNHASMAVINAADEVAVSAFIKGDIHFLDIEKVIEKTVNRTRLLDISTLEDILYLSKCATDEAQRIVEELKLGE